MKKSIILISIFLCSLSFSGYAANFYSGSSGNLDNVNSWWTNRNGTGSHPANFTANNQNFQIMNNTAPTIGANWIVSGTGSTIMLGDSTTAIYFTLPSSIFLFISPIMPVSCETSATNKSTLLA